MQSNIKIIEIIGNAILSLILSPTHITTTSQVRLATNSILETTTPIIVEFILPFDLIVVSK